MKFFGSSLDIRDNLKVAFFGKILSNMSWHLPQKRIAPLLYLVINMTDWLSRVFVEIAVSLSNSSRERSINSTERQAQGASATCNKNFTGRSQLNTVGQCQIYWGGRPTDLSSSFLHRQCSNSDTVQGQLQIWTEHSHTDLWNLKPVEISKNHFNIIWTSLKVV